MSLIVLRFVQLSAVLSTAVTLFGCGPASECAVGEVSCDGNVARTCLPAPPQYGGNFWLEDPCAAQTVCVVAEGESFCALSATKDPDCAEAGGSTCVGDDILTCAFGYATHIVACGETDQTCASPPDASPICALDTEPDPRCEGRSFVGVCGDDAAVVCQEGFAISEQPCEHGCFLTPDLNPHCLISEGPDPRCDFSVRLGRREMLQCAGDVEFYCSGEMAVEEYDCAREGRACVDDDNGPAYCAPPDAGAADAGAP